MNSLYTDMFKKESIENLVEIYEFLEKYILETCLHNKYDIINDYGDIHAPNPKYVKNCKICKRKIDFTKKETEEYEKKYIEKKNIIFNNQKCSHDELYIFKDDFTKKLYKYCKKCEKESFDLKYVVDKRHLQDYCNINNVFINFKKDNEITHTMRPYRPYGTDSIDSRIIVINN